MAMQSMDGTEGPPDTLEQELEGASDVDLRYGPGSELDAPRRACPDTAEQAAVLREMCEGRGMQSGGAKRDLAERLTDQSTPPPTKRLKQDGADDASTSVGSASPGAASSDGDAPPHMAPKMHRPQQRHTLPTPPPSLGEVDLARVLSLAAHIHASCVEAATKLYAEGSPEYERARRMADDPRVKATRESEAFKVHRRCEANYALDDGALHLMEKALPQCAPSECRWGWPRQRCSRTMG